MSRVLAPRIVLRIVVYFNGPRLLFLAEPETLKALKTLRTTQGCCNPFMTLEVQPPPKTQKTAKTLNSKP